MIKKIRDCDNCRFRPETSKVCSDYENCYMVSEYISNLRKKLQEVEVVAKECSEKYCEDCSIEKECVNGGYDLILKKISEVK